MNGVIGIDEVGRGPLAGPVTLCACYIEDESWVKEHIFQNTIRDSKKLTKDLRNNIYSTIRNKRILKTKIEYVIKSKSARYIDKHGIETAIRDCLLECVAGLKEKGVPVESLQIKLDGRLKIPMEINQSSFVKGDEKYTEIALASIIAKVHRDTYMERLGKTYKGYGWEKNVGYGTKFHREAIISMGPSKYHRMSYLKAFKRFEIAES